MMQFINDWATLFSALFFLLGFVLGYWFWLRPILRTRLRFRDFYALEDSFFGALRLKLAFIKARLAAAIMMLVSGLLALHDFLLPVATGVDWSPLWQKVPNWSWPIISFGVGALFYYLRHITERDTKQVADAVARGVPATEAQSFLGEAP